MGKSTRTPEQNAWRNRLFHCRRYGLEISPALKTFEGFMAEVGQRPTTNTYLVTKNPALGLVHGNVAWNRPCPQKTLHLTTHRAWENMRFRCFIEDAPVSPAMADFYDFLTVLGPRPSNKHRLLRKIQKDGMTEENVAWVEVGTSSQVNLQREAQQLVTNRN